MANRAYLYSLSNRPTAYADRPERISGLSEWAYAVPFAYRLLMSGDARRCSSLVSDGFEDEPVGHRSRLYAISSDFALGFARLRRFSDIVCEFATSQDLLERLAEAITFLEAHRDRYLLLETIELDAMSAERESELLACVEREIQECCRVGAALDALPADATEAGERLLQAARQAEAPFEALHGLRFDDHFDAVRDGHTEHPLGLSEWSDVLYYSLQDRAEFEATR
jgi:hypothetical protein